MRKTMERSDPPAAVRRQETAPGPLLRSPSSAIAGPGGMGQVSGIWLLPPLLVVLVGLMLAGCRNNEVTVAEMVTQAAKLDKTKQSSHAVLQDELRRLSAERALPDQLDGQRHIAAMHPESLAAKLHKILDDAQTDRILKRLPDFFPQGRQSFNAVTIESSAGFLQFYQTPHQAARQALDGPQSPFEWLATDGWFADTRYTDRATALCGLELIAGMDALSSRDPARCIAALSYAGRIIRLLGEDGHLTARLAAVDLRDKWLQLVESAARQPDFKRDDAQQILEMLLRQIAQWPQETTAWINDRAVGLQTYELVRNGHYLSLLSKTEVDALEADGMHLIRARAVQRYIDEDQVFYLDIMRRLIDLHRFPYYERRKVLNAIEDQLLVADQLEKYPQIAVEFLLPHVLTAMERIANDRARSEAWAVALAIAIGHPRPEFTINPANGQPYDLLLADEFVELIGLSDAQWPRSIRLPRR